MILLITHKDLDGNGCDIVLRSVLDKENIETLFCDNNEVDETVMQVINKHKKYTRIYITDLYVNKDTAKAINSIEEVREKLILLDHHKTALWLNKYAWATVSVCNMKNIWDKEVNVNECGTSLLLDHLLTEFPEMCECDKYDALTRFVETVRQYDTWEWKERDNREPFRLNSLLKMYGASRFNKKMIRKMLKGSLMLIDFEDDHLLNIEEHRKNDYIEHKKKDMVIIEKNDKKIGFVICDMYVSEVGNALCTFFKNKIDYAAIVTNNTVSLRSVKDVDVSEIAKEHGGGGHFHAAGYSIDNFKLQEFYKSIL